MLGLGVRKYFRLGRDQSYRVESEGLIVICPEVERRIAAVVEHTKHFNGLVIQEPVDYQVATQGQMVGPQTGNRHGLQTCGGR